MRRLREKQNGACYHVTARSNRGEFILHSEIIKEEFIFVLQRAKKKYNFKLKHYCIMSNHIHLMIEPGKNTDISKIMQWILSVFAIRFNKIYGKRGHVWYDRFKSKIIKSMAQFIKVFEYISLNPVKAEISKNIFEYAFSAISQIKQNRHDLVEPPAPLLKMYFPEICSTLLLPTQSNQIKSNQIKSNRLILSLKYGTFL